MGNFVDFVPFLVFKIYFCIFATTRYKNYGELYEFKQRF